MSSSRTSKCQNPEKTRRFHADIIFVHPFSRYVLRCFMLQMQMAVLVKYVISSLILIVKNNFTCENTANSSSKIITQMSLNCLYRAYSRNCYVKCNFILITFWNLYTASQMNLKKINNILLFFFLSLSMHCYNLMNFPTKTFLDNIFDDVCDQHENFLFSKLL